MVENVLPDQDASLDDLPQPDFVGEKIALRRIGKDPT
jgi:hypothetical protein